MCCRDKNCGVLIERAVLFFCRVHFVHNSVFLLLQIVVESIQYLEFFSRFEVISSRAFPIVIVV